MSLQQAARGSGSWPGMQGPEGSSTCILSEALLTRNPKGREAKDQPQGSQPVVHKQPRPRV